jgi:anthranilate phosphoribosyltransferase
MDPLDFAIDRAPISALAGGDAAENAAITTAIFAGEKGAPRDAVVLNAAAAIAAYEGQMDLSLHDRMQKGIERATKAIDSGAATTLLSQWAALSQKLAAS